MNALSKDKKKMYYDEVFKIVQEKGGQLITKEYKTAKTKMEIVCKKGHEFSINPNNLKSGNWCRKCSMVRFTIDDIKEFAKTLDGECLSTYYNNDYKKLLKWRCNKGHVWEDSLYNVKNHNIWCKKCRSDTYKTSWLYAKRKIRMHSGSLLTRPLDESAKITDMLHIKCGNGHIFHRSVRDILYSDDRWCRQCNIKKHQRMEYYKLKKVATERGYVLISSPDDYTGQEGKLIYKCPKGHIWECSGGNFKGMRNCAFCLNDSRRISKEKLLSIANERYGRLLTPYSEYIDSKQKLLWECSNSHVFEGSVDAIVRGFWCPICTGRFKQETKCKYIIETLTGRLFSKNRSILNSSIEGIDSFLELDMYNESLKLAVEYNGEQHYMFIEYFHEDQNGLEKQIKRDLIKRKACQDLGIELIVVPYFYKTDEEKFEYIKEQLEIRNVQIVNSEFNMKNYYLKEDTV